MPEALSHEALVMLLKLRYGGDVVDTDFILEARHFAELFDWPAVRERCECTLEALLKDTSSLNAESLLAVLMHTEENVGIPTRLKAAALSAAVRQWSKITDIASTEVDPRRFAEFSLLNRVRARDGHVVNSIEEYLHAAEDDLFMWERDMALNAPAKVRKQLELSWEHWHQVLFEYGHVFGAAKAESWRGVVLKKREVLREERARGEGDGMHLPPGRVWFVPTPHWREVPPNAICPAGLEYRLDMETGRNFARLC